MKNMDRLACLFMLAALVGTSTAQSGGTYVITQSVVANGGGTSGGGTFSVTGTTGQSLAGTLSSGAPFYVRGGFWQNSSSSNVSVSGRVTTSGGRGVRNAIVNLRDQLNVTRQVLTGPFGAYRLDNVIPGQTYTISVTSRRFQFTSQTISINDDLSGVNFVSSP